MGVHVLVEGETPSTRRVLETEARSVELEHLQGNREVRVARQQAQQLRVGWLELHAHHPWRGSAELRVLSEGVAAKNGATNISDHDIPFLLRRRVVHHSLTPSRGRGGERLQRGGVGILEAS